MRLAKLICFATAALFAGSVSGAGADKSGPLIN